MTDQNSGQITTFGALDPGDWFECGIHPDPKGNCWMCGHVWVKINEMSFRLLGDPRARPYFFIHRADCIPIPEIPVVKVA